jgi:hypothetical protein
MKNPLLALAGRGFFIIMIIKLVAWILVKKYSSKMPDLAARDRALPCLYVYHTFFLFNPVI